MYACVFAYMHTRVHGWGEWRLDRGSLIMKNFSQSLTCPTDVDAEVGNLCQGGFSTGCTGLTCDYRASWVVRGGSVDFNISARTSDSATQWVGIGFSNDRLMVSNCYE